MIEDRRNLGVGGRQIVRVRLLGRGEPPEAGTADSDDGSFELPAEGLTLVN